jgi:hypothetical protein
MNDYKILKANHLARTGLVTNHPLLPGLAIYQQGGLDNYCGFYAIFNLVNFLKFKETDGEQTDYMGLGGKKPFSAFQPLMTRSMLDLHHKLPGFGGDGAEAEQLHQPFETVLQAASINATVGTQRTLDSPTSILALAAVHEGKNDKLGHWVALVGSDHFSNIPNCKSAMNWDGAVLDSQRNYGSWSFRNPKFHAKRFGENEQSSSTFIVEKSLLVLGI